MHRVRPAPIPVEKPSAATNVSTGASAGRGILHQWFPAWWGWSEADQGTAEGLESSVEQQIEGQLLDALADTVDNNSLLRRDVVFCQINFTLKEGTFHLCSLEKEKSFAQQEGQAQDDIKLVINLIFMCEFSGHCFMVLLSHLFFFFLGDQFLSSSLKTFN